MDSDRAVMIRYQDHNKRRVGSGLRIGGTLVLTAGHVASGSDYTVLLNSSEVSAKVALCSPDPIIDLALLEIDGGPELPRLKCARINRDLVATVSGCAALGFPDYQKGNHERRMVQIDGSIPTAEGNRARLGAGITAGYLTFKVTGPLPRDLPQIEGANLEDTPWAGMSGGVVFTATNHILGVIRHHNPAAGTGTLALTAIDDIESLPNPHRAHFWTALGVTFPEHLPRLPQGEKTGEKSTRRIGSEMFSDLIHMLSAELDDPREIAAIARRGGVNMARFHHDANAVDTWTDLLALTVRDKTDEQLLTETMKFSLDPRLRELIRRWLNQPWP